jgi:hypothetical protein
MIRGDLPGERLLMDWLGDVYLICAVVGGTLLVVQTILMAVGGHHDGDMGADGADATHADGSVGHDMGMLKWLSLKAVISSLTFFGLGGLAAQKAGLGPYTGLAISLAAGLGAVFLVASLMAGMSRMQSKGNLDLRNAVGVVGKVYLRIPAGRGGVGKATLEVQGRFIEVEAVTSGPEIPTGMPIRVVAVPSPDTLEVAVMER